MSCLTSRWPRISMLMLCSLGTGGALAQTQTYATPGNYTYIVPAGVTALQVTVAGGGGGGGGYDLLQTGNGGGGGSGALLQGRLPVTPGSTVQITVGGGGGGGTSDSDGNPAAGGNGGAGLGSGGAGSTIHQNKGRQGTPLGGFFH